MGEPAHPARSCEHGTITENEHDISPQVEGDPADDTPGSEFERWRRESALGTVGTGIAKGLRNVFAPTDDHQVIVAEAPGDPPGSGEGLRVILDPDDPAKSVAFVPRPVEPDDETPPEPPRADPRPAG